MAGHPLSPKEANEFKMPMPPPPLLTRSTNEFYDTPTHMRFTSPPQTPQGSPSKHQQPPGAYDLPNVFDNAMKLIPANNGSPAKNTRSQLQPTSPGKNGIASHATDVDLPDYAVAGAAPGSPTRKGNKENTPPGGRPGVKTQSSFVTQAAQSRQEAYKTRDEPKVNIQRGLSPEDVEKVQKPSVKRLANVTQLCRAPNCHCYESVD